MTEVVDKATVELNARFFGDEGQLYEFAAMLMDKNTTSEQLRDLIETPRLMLLSHSSTLFVAFNPGLMSSRYSSVPWPVHQAWSNYEKCTRS